MPYLINQESCVFTSKSLYLHFSQNILVMDCLYIKKNEKCIPLVDFVDKCKYFSLASSLLLIELIFEFNFLQDETKFGGRGHDLSELLHFCFKKGVPLETVKVLMSEVCALERSTLHEAEQV